MIEGQSSADQRNLAVIAGNGLSIAFTEKLILGNITKKLLERLTTLGDGDRDLQSALEAIASPFDDESREPDARDFERLVGAFETHAATIQQLDSLVDLLPNASASLQDSISEVVHFTQWLRDIGTGLVLDTIRESEPESIQDTLAVHSMLNAMKDSFGGYITFANLNYDNLVMKAFTSMSFPFCDMARGDFKIDFHVTDDEEGEPRTVGTYGAHPLRQDLDFPQGSGHRIRLVHLHGSFTYWESRETKQQIKIVSEAVHNHSLLAQTDIDGNTWRPLVVLANTKEKPRRVQEPPFSLGYDALDAGLSTAEHWWIVGYSFRDSSVNERLLKAFVASPATPTVLVCTYGEELSRSSIEHVFGWDARQGSSKDWLLIDRGGVSGHQNREGWQRFIL